ncbi:hypothetical protein HPB47_019899 [Ixodes persulcatus]|uniref:Uncharacterized protein n=1 Tax=Ixodes persulcatus TaxID=34615 RepID=A0AC60QGW5_IXOPE|nr:hypothetical protein HPB47_019899 [Ixodes persulcatus]
MHLGRDDDRRPDLMPCLGHGITETERSMLMVPAQCTESAQSQWGTPRVGLRKRRSRWRSFAAPGLESSLTHKKPAEISLAKWSAPSLVEYLVRLKCRGCIWSGPLVTRVTLGMRQQMLKPEPGGQVNPDLSFKEALKARKLDRRVFSGPCGGLGKEEWTWRRLHMDTLVTPAKFHQCDVIGVQKRMVAGALHAQAAIGALE